MQVDGAEQINNMQVDEAADTTTERGVFDLLPDELILMIGTIHPDVYNRMLRLNLHFLHILGDKTGIQQLFAQHLRVKQDRTNKTFSIKISLNNLLIVMHDQPSGYIHNGMMSWENAYKSHIDTPVHRIDLLSSMIICYRDKNNNIDNLPTFIQSYDNVLTQIEPRLTFLWTNLPVDHIRIGYLDYMRGTRLFYNGNTLVNSPCCHSIFCHCSKIHENYDLYMNLYQKYLPYLTREFHATIWNKLRKFILSLPTVCRENIILPEPL
jgi:hypothetical protein